MDQKTMVISYNRIDGTPIGRYEKGNAISYSADWDFDDFGMATLEALLIGSPSEAYEVVKKQSNAASSALQNLERLLTQDLPTVKDVYVYVGVSAMTPALEFIKKLQALGKEVHMVACDCDLGVKRRFAHRLGIDIVMSGCGGERECGRIFADHTK